MSTIREQIIVALVAALNAAAPGSGITGLTIHRERTRPIETDSLPAVLVYFDDDVPKPLGQQIYRAPLTERQLTLAVECRAQGSASISPDAALDPLLIFVFSTVRADVTLGGLASEFEEGKTQWNSREGDVPIAAARLSFTVRYRTSRLDPTSKS